MADEHILAVPEDPKITLLRCKLALLIGPDECPEYDTIKAQRPQALEEPWSDDMSGPIKHVGTHIEPSGWERCHWIWQLAHICDNSVQQQNVRNVRGHRRPSLRPDPPARPNQLRREHNNLS